MIANVSSLPVAMVVTGAAQGEGTGGEAPTLGHLPFKEGQIYGFFPCA